MKKQLFASCLLAVGMLSALSNEQIDAQIKQLENKKAIIDQQIYEANEDADRLMTRDFFGSQTASGDADRLQEQSQELQRQIDALKKKRHKG